MKVERFTVLFLPICKQFGGVRIPRYWCLLKRAILRKRKCLVGELHSAKFTQKWTQWHSSKLFMPDCRSLFQEIPFWWSTI